MHDDLIRPPNSVDTTSKSLLIRIKTGDGVAWQQLAAVYGPIILFWVNEHHIPREDARDIYQEVFLAVSRNIERFERQDGSGKFRRWLKVITQSKVNNHFRRLVAERAAGGTASALDLKNIPDPEIDDATLDAAPELTESENATIVQSVLRLIQGEFQETTWKSFWLTAVEERSANDAAAELNLTAEAVRKNKSRVLARLREALSEHMT